VKFPDDVIELANKLEVRLNDVLITVAVRQHLKNLKASREYNDATKWKPPVGTPLRTKSGLSIKKINRIALIKRKAKERDKKRAKETGQN